MCSELTPCHVQNHLSLPSNLPLHWEILCLFFMEPWSVDACLKAIRPEPILPERAVHQCPHGGKSFTIQEMARGMADFLDALGEVMPRLGPLDFEIQKSSLSRMLGLVMFGCVRTLKYLETIRSRCDWELDGFPNGDDVFVDWETGTSYRICRPICALGSITFTESRPNLRACTLGRAKLAISTSMSGTSSPTSRKP